MPLTADVAAQQVQVTYLVLNNLKYLGNSLCTKEQTQYCLAHCLDYSPDFGPIVNSYYHYFQDRLRSLHRLVYDIEAERGRNEQCIDSILRAEKAADSPTTADDSSGSSQQVGAKLDVFLFMCDISYCHVVQF